MHQKIHATRRPRRASNQLAVIAAIAAVTLAACATSNDAGGPSSSNAQTAATSESSSAPSTAIDAPDPCPPSMGQCDPIAVVDLDGSGEPAGVSLHPNGTAVLTVVTADDERLWIDVATDLETLTAPADTSELAKAIAFYDLDGRPGSEIVVPVGMRGAVSVFQVVALRDGDLELVSPPGDTLDITLGMGLWTFPGDRILARVLCRDGGLTLGSAEMPNPQRAREVDFRSTLDGPQVGEASEWIVDGPARTVDPAALTDMSVGQTHFKCEDTRIESLLGSNTGLVPQAEGCDSTDDLTPVVDAAIDSLPAPPVGSWQLDVAAAGDLEACSRLDVLTITTDMPTNTSPVAVLLFRDGKFVGPTSTCFAPIESAESDGDDTVTVVYRYPEAGENNAASSGRATFTYTWKDGKIVSAGAAPERLTELMGCTP